MSGKKLKIKSYNLKNLRTPSTFALFGKHGTGKTSIEKWILYYLKNQTRLGLVISETAEKSGDFDNIIPNTLIWGSYNSEKIAKLIKNQKTLRYFKETIKHKKYVNKEIRAVVVMDDILGDPTWAKDKGIKEMFFNGRHLRISLIMGIQEVMGLKKRFRGDLDYTIITKLTTEQAKEDVYKYYWNSSFGDKKDCINIINECTKGYNALIIDQKKVATASSIRDCVYYLKLPDPEKFLPKFRIGSKIIWYLHSKAYNKHWERDEIFSDRRSRYKKYNPSSNSGSKSKSNRKKDERRRIKLV